MHPSPLQLEDYFVIAFSITANRAFDTKKAAEADFSDLVVTTSNRKDVEPDKRHWEVSLGMKLQPGPQVNVPYYFSIELVGLFSVADEYPEAHVGKIVDTNAPSVLFSAAREIVRAAMSQGPYRPLMMPTVSFYPDTKPKVEPTEAAPATAEQTAKVTPPAAGHRTHQKN